MFDRVHNFSAGPSALPEDALRRAAASLLNHQGAGMSVMEMSHRSKAFDAIFQETKAKLRAALCVPDSHEILFLQGGATLQFAMAPMNLLQGKGRADYAVTGNFAQAAYAEAQKYGDISLAASTADRHHSYIPTQADLTLDPAAAYFYYCANNTIYGTEWQYVPETGGVPIVCDMSSNILSRPIDVSKYGIIFAGAQKNMGPAGLTVVILRRDLAGNEFAYTPSMLSYQKMIDSDSMLNTPPCFAIYMLGLVLDWVAASGGIAAMQALRTERAALVYSAVDRARLLTCPVEPSARSEMNVVFRAEDEALNEKFVKEAAAAGLVNLKGHRSVGGMRASMYNAMPMAGAQALADFIERFDKENG